jgi:hypothetical protein
MLETPKALDTIIFKQTKNTNTQNLRTKHKKKIILLVKILMDVTMDNQQETKNFIPFKFKSYN